MARQIDIENLSEEDVAYLEQRHWMIQELEFQGHDWATLRAEALGEELPASDEADENGSVDQTDGSEPEEEPEDYSEYSFAELKAEIDDRNDGKEDDDETRISKAGSADELRARLVADDAAVVEEDDSADE